VTPHHELLRAGECDAGGRHHEAIDALARGARAGDADCKAWLGLRLMTGDRAPALPTEGLGLLAESAAQGSGFAASRAAAVLALGVRNPPDWQGAKLWLGRAAVLGWKPARQQIRALGAQALTEAEVSAGDWERLASAIELSRWQHFPAPVVHSEQPRVCTFPGFITAEQCAALIGLAAGRLQRALVYDAAARRDIVHATRSNTVATFGFDAIEFLQVLVQQRMAAACATPATHFEAPTLLHYDVGERIENHFDFVDPATTPDYAGEIARLGQRKITFIVYLNEGYEGGNTAFPRLGFEHRGSMGEGILFINALADLSPDLRTLHAGCEIKSGEKWILTQFIRSRPMRQPITLP